MTTSVDSIFATDSAGSMTVFDLRVGTTLMHYKTENNAISPKCLSVFNDRIVGAGKGPIIRTWALNSQEKLQVRMVCPGSVGCCSVDPDGHYIAVSTGTKLLIWQLSSGRLWCTTNNHYQDITVIRWSKDLDYIVTGGEDGLVCVWKFSYLISSENLGSGTSPEPRFTFSHHSVGVTDLHLGYGGQYRMLFTVSKDKTCRMYDLATGNQLMNVIFDEKPTAVIVDGDEKRAFVGMFNGAIKSFSLLDPPRSLDYHYKESETNFVLPGHNKAVSCFAFSFDDTILVSGSTDETIRLWHVPSKQLMRTIGMKGAITNVIVGLLPESLQAYDLQSTTVIKSFQKRYDDSEETPTVEVACPDDQYTFVPRRATRSHEGDDMTALKEENEKLRREKDHMFEFAKQMILKELCDKSPGSSKNNVTKKFSKKFKKRGG